MWHVFHKIVDSIFPPDEETKRVRHCTKEHITTLYQPTVRDGVTILLPFKDPTVRALIHQAKFHYQTHAYTLLAHILSHHLQQVTPEPHQLIPTPLSRRRWRERGYNQVTEVATRAVSTIPNCTIASNLLKRTRHTQPQTALSQAERRTNVSHAFTCVKERNITAIIILDDVCTTGSTLAAARTACAQTYPHVPIVCLALAG